MCVFVGSHSWLFLRALCCKLCDTKQTFPIFHRSPETRLGQKTYKSVTCIYNHTSPQVLIWWVVASTWLCQQLCNYNLWEGITVSARRNEWTYVFDPQRMCGGLKQEPGSQLIGKLKVRKMLFNLPLTRAVLLPSVGPNSVSQHIQVSVCLNQCAWQMVRNSLPLQICIVWIWERLWIQNSGKHLKVGTVWTNPSELFFSPLYKSFCLLLYAQQSGTL